MGVYLTVHGIIFLPALHNSVRPFYPRRQKVFRRGAAVVGDLEVIDSDVGRPAFESQQRVMGVNENRLDIEKNIGVNNRGRKKK